MRSDLEPDEKKEAVAAAKQTLIEIRNLNQKTKKRGSVLFQGIDVEELKDEEEPAPALPQSRPRRNTRILEPSNTTIEGYLNKKGKQSLIKWKPRYVSVKNGRIYLYHSHKSYKASNYIQMKDVQEVSVYKAQSLKFDVVTSNRVLKLQANSQEEFEKWISALKNYNQAQDPQKALNITQTTKEVIFEDLDGSSRKRDLMKLSKLQKVGIQKRKPRAPQIYYEVPLEEETSCCSCLAFLRKKKTPLKEPLLIN